LHKIRFLKLITIFIVFFEMPIRERFIKFNYDQLIVISRLYHIFLRLFLTK